MTDVFSFHLREQEFDPVPILLMTQDRYGLRRVGKAAIHRRPNVAIEIRQERFHESLRHQQVAHQLDDGQRLTHRHFVDGSGR